MKWIIGTLTLILPPTKKMNSKEKIELLQDAMKSEEAKNKLIDI